jgi:uncharacterized protein YndB with AHSA1/START domain
MMKNVGNLKITTPTDREIVMTRVFDAPRKLVYEAFTTPALLKRWLGVFGRWSLAVCEVDLRVGGVCRYVWRDTEGKEMGMRAVFREVAAPERLVSTEKFDDPWYEGEAVGTNQFVEQNGKTTLTNTLLYASKEVRDAVLQIPMEQGIAASYDKLNELLKGYTTPRSIPASAS